MILRTLNVFCRLFRRETLAVKLAVDETVRQTVIEVQLCFIVFVMSLIMIMDHLEEKVDELQRIPISI